MVSSHTRAWRVSLGAWVAHSLLLVALVGCGTTTPVTVSSAGQNVVATYAGDTLTFDEFERQYRSATGIRAEGDSLEAYRDFLKRYVNFRLKVTAGEEAGLATSPSLQEELQSYRTRLARPYLLDREVIDPIVALLYERRRELVDVSHILRNVPPDAAPTDTLAAYRRLQAVRDSALAGVDFGDLALRHSEDPSASDAGGSRGYRGRLGYFTGGNLVEPFESYAYDTPVGGISPVFRTQFGFHILQVHDRRPAVGDIRVSHLMLVPEPLPEDSARVRSLMGALQDSLASGVPFSDLAAEYSQDSQSASRGGDLGMIGYTAPLPETFKNAAFRLDTVGAVSDVVETPFGFHIIKLTGREDPPTYDEAYEDLKSLASRLPRAQAAQAALARTILARRGARVDTTRAVAAFAGMPSDSVVALLERDAPSFRARADTFFVTPDTSFTVADLSSALSQQTVGTGQDTEGLILRLVEAFVTNQAIDMESRDLEDRNAEFSRLMKEFQDGLILFEIMEDSVWAVAENDSAGLRAYYTEHADSYRWPDRTRIITLQSASDSLLLEAVDRYDAGSSLADLVAGESALRSDTTLVADSTQAIYDRALRLEKGGHTGVLPHRGEYVVLVNDGIEPARLRTFEEARAIVVGEYQDVVEAKLVDRLRRRFLVHTFPERLDQAFMNEEDDDASRQAP